MDTVFEALITPHRSLSRRGLHIIIGCTCTVSFCVTALFWWLGAWPIAGSARASEFLVLTESELRIQKTDASGARTEQVLPSAWIGVTLEERAGRAPGLYLSASGRRLEIASALGEPDKRDLAHALAAALHRWRHPTFDNPQLDEG
jgi:uncharacterized membrane protein